MHICSCWHSWHDHHLVSSVHFVPLDSAYDYYGHMIVLSNVPGVPFWWWSTSITRPVFDAPIRSFFLALADECHSQTPRKECLSKKLPKLSVKVHIIFLGTSSRPVQDIELRDILQNVDLNEDLTTVCSTLSTVATKPSHQLSHANADGGNQHFVEGGILRKRMKGCSVILPRTHNK
jgi:hypothetical protein